MKTLLDLDQLRTFLLISETGSFTKTADIVFRTQSAISMQIRRLEERIGKPLFTKTGRHLRLTPFGEDLVVYAQRMLELNDETVNLFRSNRAQDNVRIGLPDLYLEHMMHDTLQPIFTHHPAIETSLYCGPSDRLNDQLRRGVLDLAIVTLQPDHKKVEVLGTSQFVFVTSATHSPHQQEIVPLALSHTSCLWRKISTEALSEMHREYRVILSSSSIRAVSLAVLCGSAITVMPANMVEPGMRILTAADGYPTLSPCILSLQRAQRVSTTAIDLVAEAIHNSFQHNIIRSGCLPH